MVPIQALSLSRSLSALHIQPLPFFIHSSLQSYSSLVSLHEIVSGQSFRKSTHTFSVGLRSGLSLVSLIWPHQVINTVIVSHYCTALASNLRSLSCLTTNALPAHGVLRTPSVFFFSRIFLLIAVFVYPLHFSGRAAEKHPKRPDIAIAMLHGKDVVFLTMFMSNKFNFAP